MSEFTVTIEVDEPQPSDDRVDEILELMSKMGLPTVVATAEDGNPELMISVESSDLLQAFFFATAVARTELQVKPLKVTAELVTV